METKLHKSSRGIWLFADGKHVKTFPANLESAILPCLQQGKINLASKRLSELETVELKKVLAKNVIDSYLENLKKNEPLVYKLIANHEFIGTRIVHGHKGDRYEIVFSNQLKLKTNFKLYTAYPVKLPEAYLNY